MGLWGFVVIMSMTSIFVNILIFVRNKYHPLGMQRVNTAAHNVLFGHSLSTLGTTDPVNVLSPFEFLWELRETYYYIC